MAQSGAGKGRLFLLKVTAGVSPVSYTTVGGLRATSISIANEMVDITSKDNAPWRKLLAGAGLRTISLAGSGIFTDSVAENLVRGWSLDGSMNSFQVIAENGDKFTGQFLVSKFEYTGNYNGAQEYSMAMEASDTVVFTAHP